MTVCGFHDIVSGERALSVGHLFAANKHGLDKALVPRRRRVSSGMRLEH